LDAYSKDKATLLNRLENFRKGNFAKLPAYGEADLRKLAFWMATGSGKTFLLHLNLLQFKRYHPFDPQNIILLTPTLTLAEQHLFDLKASGINAEYGLTAPLDFNGVLVFEISKLYKEATAKPKKGGVSRPTSEFLGSRPNLLLVDEGHKGSSNAGDRKTERTWRDIRKALTENGGFTFEYSATFGQVAEEDEELYFEYARSIAFEYAYGKFYKDGYGKDFWVANLKVYDTVQAAPTLLLGALLTFYQAQRLYTDKLAEFAPYQLEKPLMVFVGANVTAGTNPEVVEVIEFLDRFLKERDKLPGEVFAILKGHSGLEGLPGHDLFETKFDYLQSLHYSEKSMYHEISQTLFGGNGQLVLRQLKRAEGEVGITLTDSAKDTYCGVINVGDVRGFLDKVKAKGITVAEDDHLTGSLFNNINQPNSPVNFLVGSKKFIEGWSSYRVAVMGLLRVGKGAGAQVVQLFGRGVRLKGLNTSLKRSSLAPGFPEHLDKLETISIFGLKADYLKIFLDTLADEGVSNTVSLLAPITLNPNFVAAGLNTLEIEPGFDFSKIAIIYSADSPNAAVTIDLSVSLESGKLSAVQATTSSLPTMQLSASPNLLKLLDFNQLYFEALRLRNENQWYNLTITKTAVRKFFEEKVFLIAPDYIREPKTLEAQRVIEISLIEALQKTLKNFYTSEYKRYESVRLRTKILNSRDENFPVQKDASGVIINAYKLTVPENLVTQVQAIIDNSSHLNSQDVSLPLPRLHFDSHLYNPIMVKSAGVELSVSPTALVDSERRFISDLKTFWQDHYQTSEWLNYQLYLLRNRDEPGKGVGFFKTAGFYPDFLLWLVKGDKQCLIFIDPKGLTRYTSEKVQLLKDIRNLSGNPKINMPLLSFFTTPTNPADITGNPHVGKPNAKQLTRQDFILFQSDPKYIAEILDEAKSIISL
jgi:Type III restriction enzyme, res subunit